MAKVNVETLAITGFVDTKRIESGLNRMNSMVQGFDKKLSKGLGAASAGIAALAGGMTVAAVAMGTLSAAMDVEDQTVGLGKAANLSGTELKAFRDNIIDMGTEMRGIRTDELLDIATAGAKLGVPTDQLEAYTKNIAMLKTAFDDMSADEISNGIGILTNQFSLEAASGALKLGSAIDALADSAATNGADLINTMQRMGGSANLLGLGADQTAALATALLDTGSSAEKAGGALNRLFIDIADQSKSADFAKLLGVSEADFQKMLHDDPMKALSGFLRSLEGKDLGQVGSMLGSVGITSGEDIAEIAKLSLQTDKLNGFLKVANEQFLSGARAQESYAASSETTRARLDQLFNQFTKLAVVLGDIALPLLNDALDSINGIITSNREQIDNAVAGIGLLDNVWAYLKPIGSMLQLVFGSIVNYLKMTFSQLKGSLVTLINLIPGVEIDRGDSFTQVDLANGVMEDFEKIGKSFEVYTNPLKLPFFQPENIVPALLDSLKPDTGARIADAIAGVDESSTPFAATAKVEAPKLASNLQLGSVDAYRTMASFRMGNTKDQAQLQIAQNTKASTRSLQNIERNLKFEQAVI